MKSSLRKSIWRSHQTLWSLPLSNVTWHSGTWPYTMTPSIDQTLHQFANLLPNWTLLPILTLLPNFGGFRWALQRVRLAGGGPLLLRTPCPVPFGTCICSNVETILSWACHVYGPFEFRRSLGTSNLLVIECQSPKGQGKITLIPIETCKPWHLQYFRSEAKWLYTFIAQFGGRHEDLSPPRKFMSSEGESPRVTWIFWVGQIFVSPFALGRHEFSGWDKSSCLPPNWAINCLLYRKLKHGVIQRRALCRETRQGNTTSGGKHDDLFSLHVTSLDQSYFFIRHINYMRYNNIWPCNPQSHCSHWQSNKQWYLRYFQMFRTGA